jgi:hypothetical protein
MKEDRRRRHDRRLREAGLARICIWVPQEDIENLRAIAKKMREESTASEPTPVLRKRLR